MIRFARRSARESRWLRVLGTLNEYQARLFVADKALDQGRGGISRLSELTGMSRTTITKAVAELNSRKKLAVAEQGQIREAGGGRKKVEDADPVLPVQLGKILEETSAGDPMSALRWTNKSTEAMAEELTRQGHPVSDKTVARCLRKTGYSMQSNQKTRGRPATPEPGPAVPLHQPAGSLLPEQRSSRWKASGGGGNWPDATGSRGPSES